MRRSTKLLRNYFLVVGLLSIIAIIPEGALIALLILTPLSLISASFYWLLVYLVIGSPTILFYSAALVPMWLASTASRDRVGRIAAAALIPIIVAFGPGMLSQKEAAQFAMRMSEDDLSRPIALGPKSVEIIEDGKPCLSIYCGTTGDRDAPCDEICRRLLFNGEADWVRMTRIPDVRMNERSERITSVTYRIEHREVCPAFYPPDTKVDKAVQDRLLSGDCVIAETADNATPDAKVKFTIRYSDENPPEQGPHFASIVSVKELQIERRQADVLVPALQQTETIAQTLAIPFYFGAETSINGGRNGPTIGRKTLVMKPIDLARVLRDTFGYTLADISASPPADPRKIAARILALPLNSTPAFTSPEQDALNDFMNLVIKEPVLSDIDFDVVRRIITDSRVTKVEIGMAIERSFRKFTVQFEPLIPVVLDRMSAPILERIGNERIESEQARKETISVYKGWLSWSLMNYSAGSLRPYRDKMVSIVAAQPDSSSYGVLARLAEVGDNDAVNLLIRLLDSNSQVSAFAAIAACRASAEAWPALEPTVLAHLTLPRQGGFLGDSERPLLLGLVRFGKKSLAISMIESSGMLDKESTLKRLAKFEQGFDPVHCRDHSL